MGSATGVKLFWTARRRPPRGGEVTSKLLWLTNLVFIADSLLHFYFGCGGLAFPGGFHLAVKLDGTGGRLFEIFGWEKD
jgi:hypothetical protein